MRNRAKCKLCGDIIESFHRHDFVQCSCDEISVDGGHDYWRCGARNWENFLRIDDDGKEVIVKVEENDPHTTLSDEIPKDEMKKVLTKSELIEMLKDSIETISKLPPQAMHSYVTQYDMQSLMCLLYAILKDD